MIVYEPNKNWFRDIWNLTTSWTIKKIIWGVLMSGALYVYFLYDDRR